MSILAALVRAYDRLPDAPPFGYSMEKIGFVIGLNEDGSVASVTDLRVPSGKKMQLKPFLVPQPIKRASNIAPNFLWDKTSYALGVKLEDGDRTIREHAAFRERHEKELCGTEDPGLNAFLLFLRRWTPAQFTPPLWPDEMKDQNVIFTLESDRLKNAWLHNRPAAKSLWAQLSAGDGDNLRICLVTGRKSPVARLHPSIKGVPGGQPTGGSIVSFNLEAFTSYGHKQGDNAPVSEYAAFAYTTVLNRFLENNSKHKLLIADTSTVFWADSSKIEIAETAEALFSYMFGDLDPSETDEAEAKKVGILLKRIEMGEPLEKLDPDLAKGVRFHVLGLAPNAARISVRFYYENNFRDLAENYRDYYKDIRFDLRSQDQHVNLYRLALRTAPARKDRNNTITFDKKQISPLLAGELFRSILTGDRFPRSLLAQILMRIRSDHILDSLRISLIKAVIVRNMRKEGRLPKEDYLVRSDPDDPNPSRRLGKLFALIERAQLAALGDRINTTVKDKYLGACATTPAQIFSKLLLNAEEHHLKRLRNGHSDADWIKSAEQARRVGASINRDIGRLSATFANSFPKQHSDEEQGLFLIGYYQERFGERKTKDDGGDPIDDGQTIEEEE